MKIRPADPSASLPPESEGVGKGREVPEFSTGEMPEVAASAGVEKGQLPSELGLVSGPELEQKFLDLALGVYDSVFAGSEIEDIRSMLLEQIQEDPFIQGKLERISGLLSKGN